MNMEPFISVLSKYLDMPSVQLVVVALRSGQEKYASGKITDRDVDAGARKLCKLIKGALGMNVMSVEQDVGSKFDEWCLDNVKTIIAGSLGALTPSAAIDFFKTSEGSASSEERVTKLF